MDDGPKFKSVLKPIGCQDLTNESWSELMFGSSPKRGQTKLSVCVQSRFLEDAFLGVKELTNERIVESGLPFLNDGHFETAIVCSLSVYWDGSPNVQVVMFTPVAQGKFCLYQSLVGELKVLSGATILPVEGIVHG